MIQNHRCPLNPVPFAAQALNTNGQRGRHSSPPPYSSRLRPVSTNTNLRSLAGHWQKVSGPGSWFFLPTLDHTKCREMFERAKISRRFGLKRVAGSLHNTVLKGAPQPFSSLWFLQTTLSDHSWKYPQPWTPSLQSEITREGSRMDTLLW